MYPVSQQFLQAIRAQNRRVDARVTIDYTDPFIETSLTVTPNEQTNVSYPQQVADGVTIVPHRWASLDGTWRLNEPWRLAPLPQDLSQFQFGWWGRQLASAAGAFSAPLPTVVVTHPARPVRQLRVVGDSARG
ncbi:MAG: hypothetical protein C4346_19325, partial [Chloroflexota bacterium]